MKAAPVLTTNRQLRRHALKSLPKSGDELNGLVELSLDKLPEPWALEAPLRAWRGTQLSVQQYNATSSELPVIFRLSVRRHDGQRLRQHWRTLYRIVQLLFPGHEAFEAYPLAERLVDEAPMWHLWIMEKGSTLGLRFG